MALEDYRYDATYCPRCSNCKWIDHVYMKSARFASICPSSLYYNFDAYSAQGRMDLSLALLDDQMKWSPKVLEVIYACTLCGACDTMCKRNIDLEILEVLKGLREKVFEEKREPESARALVTGIQRFDNPWSRPRKEKTDWMQGFPVQDAMEGVETLFYAGCLPGGDFQHRLPRTAIQILKAAGVNVGVLGADERCCGSLAYQVGDRDVSVSLIKENIEAFNRLGIKELVTSCAMCFGMFKAVYPAYGTLNFPVFHIVEYIDRLIAEGRLKFEKPVNLKVTYHDPCHLGRLGESYVPWEGTRTEFGRLVPPKEFRRGTHGVYEAPRNILKSIPGLELVEMERIKENAWCCGAGGGVKTGYNDFALWTAQERLEEAQAAGVTELVTACPHCEQNFMDAAVKNGTEMRVHDILDLVVAGLGGA